jgi:hypothetical protein
LGDAADVRVAVGVVRGMVESCGCHIEWFGFGVLKVVDSS